MYENTYQHEVDYYIFFNNFNNIIIVKYLNKLT